MYLRVDPPQLPTPPPSADPTSYSLKTLPGPRPYRTYPFKDFYKEVIIKSSRKVGSSGSRVNPKPYSREALLGGSWVVTSGVISRVTTLITHIRGLITPLITTHEPPSRPDPKLWP